MSKIKRNTPAEEAAIQRGIDQDPDNPEWTADDFAKARRGGRPKSVSPKVLLSVRYDADIVEAFKATGDGYQARMNDALREYAASHRML